MYYKESHIFFLDGATRHDYIHNMTASNENNRLPRKQKDKIAK